MALSIKLSSLVLSTSTLVMCGFFSILSQPSLDLFSTFFLVFFQPSFHPVALILSFPLCSSGPVDLTRRLIFRSYFLRFSQHRPCEHHHRQPAFNGRRSTPNIRRLTLRVSVTVYGLSCIRFYTRFYTRFCTRCLTVLGRPDSAQITRTEPLLTPGNALVSFNRASGPRSHAPEIRRIRLSESTVLLHKVTIA